MVVVVVVVGCLTYYAALRLSAGVRRAELAGVPHPEPRGTGDVAAGQVAYREQPSEQPRGHNCATQRAIIEGHMTGRGPMLTGGAGRSPEGGRGGWRGKTVGASLCGRQHIEAWKVGPVTSSASFLLRSHYFGIVVPPQDNVVLGRTGFQDCRTPAIFPCDDS